MRDLNKAGVQPDEDGKYPEGVEGYAARNEKYIIKGQNLNLCQLIQYATYYFLRLSILRKHVLEQAKIKWKGEKEELEFQNDILDVKPDIKTVMVGTFFKEMAKKPCILKHLDGVLGSRRPRNYCSDDDLIVLEDSSGRIRVKPIPGLMPGDVITGTIVALKGMADSNGIFHV